MAAYISFGVDPAHLVSASVMSAPAALASAKLLMPETKRRPLTSGSEDDEQVFRLTTAASSSDRDKSLLSAATSGAISAANLVLNITAIVIAVIAFVAFLDAVVSFFASLVGFPQLTFQTILGKMTETKLIFG